MAEPDSLPGMQALTRQMQEMKRHKFRNFVMAGIFCELKLPDSVKPAVLAVGIGFVAVYGWSVLHHFTPGV
jgi:hypothetical protein